MADIMETWTPTGWRIPDDRAWTQSYTGKVIRPLAFEASMIDMRDVAHSLALTCRYNGHCQRFYSVAQHCVHIFDRCSEQAKPWALLHEIDEVYLLGDIPGTIKGLVPGLAEAEERIQRVFAEHFDLCWPVPDEVKDLDRRILLDERAAMMAPCEKDWGLVGEPLGLEFQCWTPRFAERAFLLLAKSIGLI